MKQNAYRFLFLMLIAAVSACRNDTGITTSKETNYLENPVGTSAGSKFTVTNGTAIIKHWQESQEMTSDDKKPDALEIIKGTTQGDAENDYYLLVGKNSNGLVKVAAMLTLKGDKFYFQQQEGPESLIYLQIICEGDCPTGCDPVVRTQNGNNYLVCSPCINCSKTESEMR